MAITKAPGGDYLAWDSLRVAGETYRKWLKCGDVGMAEVTYIIWKVMAPHCFVRYYKEY